MTAPNEYADKIYRLMVRLEQLSKGTSVQLNKLLSEKLKKMSGEVATSAWRTKKEVSETRKILYDIISDYDIKQQAVVDQAAMASTQAGYLAEAVALDITTKLTKAEYARIKRASFKHILREQQVTVEEFWNKYIKTSSTRLKNIPMNAYAEGWSMTKAMSALRQSTQIDKRTAKTLTRTAIMSAANKGRHNAMGKTSVTKEIYKATLDSRTSPSCRGLDGKVYNTGKGPHPPIHPNCRSVRLAVPSDMTPAEFKKDLEVSYRGPDGKTKVRKYQTYGDWIQTQPRAFQESVLGKKRTQLLADGKIKYNKMYTKDGKYLTIKDLEKHYINTTQGD